MVIDVGSKKTYDIPWKSTRRGISLYSKISGKIYESAGWVKNEYDGTVVMEVQGRETLIFELMKGLNRNQFIQIDWIDTEEMEPELESSFEVKY